MHPIFLTFNQKKALECAGICLSNLSINTLHRYFTVTDVTSILTLTANLLEPGKVLAGLGFSSMVFDKISPTRITNEDSYDDITLMSYSNKKLGFFCIDVNTVIVYELEPNIIDLFKDIKLNDDLAIGASDSPSTTNPSANNTNNMFDIYLSNARTLVAAMHKKIGYQELIDTTQFRLSIGL
jgi:hypothetical protein